MRKKRDKNGKYKVLCLCGSVGTVEGMRAKDEWVAKHVTHSYTVWQEHN